MLPVYLEKLNYGQLLERSQKLYNLMDECRLCPNECLVKRNKGERGICNSTRVVKIASCGPHFGEEPPLVGLYGSGTIFFSNCNLACRYCQNYDISHLGFGEEISVLQLSQIMLELQNRGCGNINFVSPTHFVPQLVEALSLAIEKGFDLPLVYNTGGYDSVETLKLLEDIIDIYMPDIKYSNNDAAFMYSGITNYWEVVRNAVKQMHNQVGDLKISRRGIAQRGMLIRHLVLPKDTAGSKKIIDFIAEEISCESYVNIMDQYHPAHEALKFDGLNRHVSRSEYDDIINYAVNKNLHRGLNYGG